MTNKLEKINSVFKILHENNIVYCHFKSNSNLDKSFGGNTDFDLIVDKNDISKFKKLLFEIGFKQRYSTYDKVYVGMEDFLYYDEVQGKLHHFHVHYELLFGKKLEKRFFFNINFKEYMQFDNSHQIYILQPEVELIFLIFRVIFKHDIYRLKYFLINKKMKISSAIKKELDFLIEKTDKVNFINLLSKYFSDIKKPMLNFLDEYEKKVLNQISIYKIHKEIITNNKTSIFVLDSNYYKKIYKMKNISKRYSKSWLDRGAKTIAIVGVDGSGKSTTVAELNKFLSYKLSTQVLYLGKVQNLYIRVLKFISKRLRNIGLKFLGKIIIGYMHYYMAKVKYKIFKSTLYNNKIGVISIVDRYPLKEFFTMSDPMDGPKLTSNDYKFFKSLEHDEFYKINDYPDILIILDIDIETSINRKAEHYKIKSRLEKKITAVRGIDPSCIPSRVLVVDATQDYDSVLLQVKKFVWENI